MDGIAGLRALVTGGNSGIGYGIAQKLVELGAEVIIIGRNQETLNKAVSDSNNKIRAITVDVKNWETTKEAVEKVLPIQLLVNNAGLAICKPVGTYSEEDYDKTMDTNLKSLINITQIITNDLVARKLPGRVVNISSAASSRAIYDHLIYCCSKSAVDMATKMFALELGSKNIRVNAVNPTVVLTEMGKKYWSDPSKAADMLQRIPQGRFVEIEEVVEATIFLLSNKSEMINGHCLPVEGGLLTN